VGGEAGLYLFSFLTASNPSVATLDEREGFAEVGRERVFGGEDVLAGADLDGAVAAGSADELPYGPAGAVLDEVGTMGLD
jgi:hypothetical protein